MQAQRPVAAPCPCPLHKQNKDATKKEKSVEQKIEASRDRTAAGRLLGDQVMIERMKVAGQ